MPNFINRYGQKRNNDKTSKSFPRLTNHREKVQGMNIPVQKHCPFILTH